MDQPMLHPSSDKLQAAMLENMVAYWAPYGKARGCEYNVTNHVTWFYTGIQFPLFNGVLSINSDPAGIETVHQQLADRIAAQGAPALWWTAPMSQPGNTAAILENQGLEAAGEVPAMVMELAALKQPAASIDGLRIDKVTSTEQQRLWAEIAARGTGMAEEAIGKMADIEASLTDHQYTSQQRYIGFLDDVPVATSALVMAAGLAGIYAVATLPEARHRGIGTLMTIQPLLQARDLGYALGTLQSSSEGYPIYQKIGFEDRFKFMLYFQS